MNIYLRKSPLVPILGLFVAKIIVIWCKTHCVLMLNALRFGTKCSAFWCKMQGEMVQNAVQNGAKYKSESINIHRNGIIITSFSH